MVNNFNKDFPDIPKPDMKEYYDMRQNVRKLYALGPAINPRVNDLCSTVLQIRDKNRCVESINIDTNNFTIEVEIEEGTDFDTCLKIKNEISSTIDKYIIDNIYSIDSQESAEKYENAKLYDDLSVGTYIRFDL